MKNTRMIFAMMLAVIFTAAIAPHAALAADRKTELQQRFKDRYPDLQKLRNAGKIGETSVGTVEAVNAASLDKSAKKLVDAENTDRAELYELLAKDLGTTSEKVARINGTRRIKELHNGEYYKDDDNHWHKKGE